jgi:hypothetical protein
MARPDVVTERAACNSCGQISPFVASTDGILRCAACNRTWVDPGGPPLPGSVVAEGEEFAEVVPGGWAGPSHAYTAAMVEAGWAKVSAEHLPYQCWHYHWRFDPKAAMRSERIDGTIGLLSILLIVGAIFFGVSSLSSSGGSSSRSEPAPSHHQTKVVSEGRPPPGPLLPRASAP